MEEPHNKLYNNRVSIITMQNVYSYGEDKQQQEEVQSNDE